jgi:hypothetical protein
MSATMSRAAWPALTAILLVGAAGCGSSHKKAPPATPVLSRTAFLAQANAICRRGNVQTNAAGAKLGNNPTQAQAVKLITSTFIPAIQTQIRAIRALGAPAGDQAKVTKMLDVAQADLNAVKGEPTLLFGKSSAFTPFAKLAHPYGLTQCAPTS